MHRVLFISHSPTMATGYGRVIRRIIAAFQQAGADVVAVGLGHRGEPHDLPYQILPAPYRMPAEWVARGIDRAKPEIIFTLGDPWMFDFLPGLLQRQGKQWVAYFPVDGDPLPPAWGRWVDAVDVPVVFCKFTQELIARHTGITPRLIYHGVDTSVFRPLPKDAAKARADLAGKFVVGTVARNQQRKNLPALLKAFASFSRDKPDAILYLHTQLHGEWDLPRLAEYFAIKHKIRVTGDLDPDHGMPDEMLATLYNAMDLFVLPTMAEGFGLPIIESQACGVPALVTDFSACPELLPEPVQRLKVKDTLYMRNNFEQAIVDTDDIVAKLDHFYANRAELSALGNRCHQFAQKFDWKPICEEFLRLVESLPVEGQMASPLL